MRPLQTRAEARALDHDAITRLGVAGLALMENAGAGAFRVASTAFRGRLQNVLCVGGTGQNGGDAWVLARHLVMRGFTPTCALLGESTRVRGDAATNLAALRALGVVVTELGEASQLAAAARSATLIVDGCFGTGLDRPLTGLAEASVQALARAERPVLALDLPSGIDADTGQVLGVALGADVTATFGAAKRGLYQYPGRGYAGEIHVVELGVPVGATSCAVIDGSDLDAALPARDRAGHKASHGHVLLFAGSAGKTGAAMLAALGALRGGAGLVSVAADADTQRALDAKIVEAMTVLLPHPYELEAVLALAHGKAACLVGPGWGLEPARRELACALALRLPVPCVLDADALTAVSEAPELLRVAAGPRVLTPHPGEAARMLQRSTADLGRDRHGAARELAVQTGHVVVLKGAGTIVAAPDGRVAVCERGTPALGTGGTGDVLAGLCTALLGHLPAWEAAFCAVELHARAGELAASGDRGLLASEVAHALPRALASVRATSA